MSGAYNVLVFPAGETNSVEIHDALSRQVNINLFGASSIERLGRHLFRNYRNDLPLIHDKNFIEVFNSLLQEWSIDLVIPTHDSVVKFLSDNRDNIIKKILLPEAETATICLDKRLTYRTFADSSFIPRVFATPEDIMGEHAVFVKPARGQGAVGARLIHCNNNELKSVNWNEEVVCEYLPGDELTVDCLTDRHGRLLGTYPRSRQRTLGGISVTGKALRASEELQTIAGQINDRLHFLGMWYFQVKKDQRGAYKLLEISARCPGSQCLTRARGINLPLLSVYVAMGRDVVVIENDYDVGMDRTLVSMYDISYEYDHVYIDYDDTILTFRGIDPDIMRLLYQFRNEGKKITLVSRHAANIRQSLRTNCISEDLFTEIINLQNGEPKVDYIKAKNAIFIDNAFAERLAVQQMHKIPVFDVDTTQVLQKWLR